MPPGPSWKVCENAVAGRASRAATARPCANFRTAHLLYFDENQLRGTLRSSGAVGTTASGPFRFMVSISITPVAYEATARRFSIYTAMRRGQMAW